MQVLNYASVFPICCSWFLLRQRMYLPFALLSFLIYAHIRIYHFATQVLFVLLIQTIKKMITTVKNVHSVTQRLLVATGLLVAAFVIVGVPSLARAATFDRQLELGMTGSDVTTLQTFLATDTSIYPRGLVTGYFGALTKDAVSRFQAQNGISAVGRVGPQTLPVLNLKFANGGTTMSTTLDAPIISNVAVSANRNNANVHWTTNEYARGVVYYSNSQLATYEHENSVDVSGNVAMTDNTVRTTQDVALSNLEANTRYYYLVYTTDQDGNVSVTLPSSFQTSN